jgi:YVTN family beta-propeller protein
MKYLLALFIIILSSKGLCQEQPANDLKIDNQRVKLPYDRLVQPAGLQITFGLNSLENHALDASFSPDGKFLAVEERYSIVFISTSDKKVIFTLPNSVMPELSGGMNTYSGLIWHKNGDSLEVLWSVIGKNKRSFVASARWDGSKAAFSRLREFKAISPAELALPNELLIRKEGNSEYLYIVLNGNNLVVKQELQSGNVIWTADPGVAPYGIAYASGKLFVTNWAGNHPDPNDSHVAGLPWGSAKVSEINGSTREGSVSVIDPATGKILKSIIVGLHPNEIISDKAGRFIYVTNSNSDNVSVINAVNETVAETISVRLQPDINPFFGDSPDGLCLSSDEKTLYVANGLDNAVAVIVLGRNASIKGKAGLSLNTGFIPTGSYPSSISISNGKTLFITNLEGSGSHIAVNNPKSQDPRYNSHRMLTSVSVIENPDKKRLKAYTDTVIALNDLARATLSMEKPRQGTDPKPVPERSGEPSLFKHVIYIIKENRTYDQILGDMKQGDGDTSLCIYGAAVTPNTHKLCEEFLLLDNFMVSGKCSAEGHQWTDASIVTDYIEKNMRAWFRSYAHVQTDALVYAPSGFLWDNALARGKKVRIYGEAAVPVFPKKTTWTDNYNAYLKGEKPVFTNKTTIETVRKIQSETYPSYGSHEFPDILRAENFINELKETEAKEGDQLPELLMVALPNDHTGGTRQGLPTPRAMVADNDLALGRIVEAVTRSKFWESTVIFVVEDDSQDGWDHVSAYRTVSLVISPWSRLKTTDHNYYNQPSMVRTIELILGLPPMNIQDAIAKPMFTCFGTKKDLTPYTAVPNLIPIDEMNPALSSLSGKALYYARKSHLPEFDGVDTGSDDLMNRILWFSAKGNIPYPARYAGSGEDDE